jgi:phage tail protein X
MIIQNRTRAGWKLIQSCRMRIRRPSDRTSFLKGWPAIAVIAVVLVLSAPFFWRLFNSGQQSRQHFKVPSQIEQAALNPPLQTNTVIEAAPLQTADSAPDPIPPLNDQAKAGQQDRESLSPEVPEPAEMQPAPDMEPSIATETNSLEDPAPLPDQLESPHPPAQLGRVTVNAGDTISGIVIKVYGNYRNEYIQAVLDANPHIDDPNSIQLGESIVLPVFDFTFKNTSVDCHWLVFDRCKNLNQAVRVSDTLLSTLKTATRPVALWSPDEGLYFEVLLQGYFENRKSAQIHADRLPPEISQTVRIISGWGNETHIFSDPYAGGIHRINHE